jgi:glycogen operon protein
VDAFLSGDGEPLPDVSWLASEGGAMMPDRWNDGRRVLGLTLFAGNDRTAIWINGGRENAAAWLPQARPGATWRLEIDTSRPQAPSSTATSSFTVPARSVLVFAEA